jgi:hypothetical protein
MTKPETFKLYNLRDACNYIKSEYPELQGVDFWSYFQQAFSDQMGQNSALPLDWLEEAFPDDYEEGVDLENLSEGMQGGTFQDFKLFYHALAKEFGDASYMQVDW